MSMKKDRSMINSWSAHHAWMSAAQVRGYRYSFEPSIFFLLLVPKHTHKHTRW